MNRFQHIIQTRFNLPTLGREQEIRSGKEWLKSRFEMFENYCLPSLANQTSTNFKWMIYFDKNTPEPFASRINELRKEMNFIPVFCSLFEQDWWHTSAIELGEVSSELLLTSRVDNDDALAPDYVERLHKEIYSAGFKRGFYNFDIGILYSHGRIFRTVQKSNAFLSLLLSADGPRHTAISLRHTDADRYYPIYEIAGEPAWIQVVHGQNVSNKIRGRRLREDDAKRALPPYLSERLVPSDPRFDLLESLVLWPSRELRDAAAALRRRFTR